MHSHSMCFSRCTLQCLPPHLFASKLSTKFVKGYLAKVSRSNSQPLHRPCQVKAHWIHTTRLKRVNSLLPSPTFSIKNRFVKSVRPITRSAVLFILKAFGGDIQPFNSFQLISIHKMFQAGDMTVPGCCTFNPCSSHHEAFGTFGIFRKTWRQAPHDLVLGWTAALTWQWKMSL